MRCQIVHSLIQSFIYSGKQHTCQVIFPGAPLKINAAPGNIQGNLTKRKISNRKEFICPSGHSRRQYVNRPAGPRIRPQENQLVLLSFLMLLKSLNAWWRHQMETFCALLAICAGNSPVPGEFPTQKPVTRSFDVYFDLRPNKRLSKQSWGWWFETLSCSLWRHRNGMRILPWKHVNVCTTQSLVLHIERWSPLVTGVVGFPNDNFRICQ